MKVIVDNKIPYIREVIEQLADEVVYLPGKAFTPEVVKDADALIIRTRTICNRELLEGSNVRFIGTATIGFDHIDTAYCQQAGITWSNCPGCNAGAVEQYLHAVLLLLQKEKGINLQESCLGIIGVGHVGERIRQMAQRIGLKVLLNDPPRADEGEEGFCSLDTLAEQCNILTFHTPLIREGKYKTYHLADSTFFQKLQQAPYLINTSRGEVVDTEALLTAMNQGLVTSAVIDVWETNRTSVRSCSTRYLSAHLTLPVILPTEKPMLPAWYWKHFAVSSINGLIFILPSPTIRIKPYRRTRM